MSEILQNLRDFTVQIRKPDSETIVGTGLAVSLEGEIVTCAHVVKSAIGVHPREAIAPELTPTVAPTATLTITATATVTGTAVPPATP